MRTDLLRFQVKDMVAVFVEHTGASKEEIILFPQRRLDIAWKRKLTSLRIVFYGLSEYKKMTLSGKIFKIARRFGTIQDMLGKRGIKGQSGSADNLLRRKGQIGRTAFARHPFPEQPAQLFFRQPQSVSRGFLCKFHIWFLR